MAIIITQAKMTCGIRCEWDAHRVAHADLRTIYSRLGTSGRECRTDVIQLRSRVSIQRPRKRHRLYDPQPAN